MRYFFYWQLVILPFAPLVACHQKQEQAVATGLFKSSWERSSVEERVSQTIDYSLKFHSGEIAAVSGRLHVPPELPLTLLATERSNDWKVYGSLGAYVLGDEVYRTTGKLSSLGAANVNLSSLQTLFEANPKAFGKLTAQDAFESAAQSDLNSLFWGMQFLLYIHNEVLKNETLIDDEKWVKSIGLYNEGLANVSAYVFGSYSAQVRLTLKSAREHFAGAPLK